MIIRKEKERHLSLTVNSGLFESSRNCEVYVVEGDSAAVTLKLARNEFQALCLCGKILNVQKATLEKNSKER